MGVHGIDREAGFTTPNLLEAETDQAMVAASRRLVVVADHTKWGVVGLSAIAELDEASVLVTDAGMPLDAREALAESVGELLIADDSSTQESVT
jgi:DeoR/GlpR family transcriptional regulator of sugar metabolism